MANVNKLQDAQGNEYNLQDTISGYQNATQVNTAVTSHHDSTKQDTLVSGTNIKTVNNNSLLGSGNISITASISSAGSSTTPIYINSSGTPTACSYSLGSLASHSYQTSYSSVSSTSHSVVIKEYYSGTSGYRIWSTGYCEQWGVTSYNVTHETVSFTKTFKDTNYTVLVTPYSKKTAGGTGGYSNAPGFQSKTTSSMYIDMVANADYATYWKASGYLASGQY